MAHSRYRNVTEKSQKHSKNITGIMARIIVHLREDAIKTDGTAPVVLHVNMQNKKAFLYTGVYDTGVYVNPDKWNSESLKIKGNTKEVP